MKGDLSIGDRHREALVQSDEGAAGLGEDVEVAKDASAVKGNIKDPLPGPGGIEFGELESNGVSSVGNGEVVAEVAIAAGLIKGLRASAGDGVRGAIGRTAGVGRVGGPDDARGRYTHRLRHAREWK